MSNGEHDVLDRIESELGRIASAVKKIDESIRGNGKPGIERRLGKLEDLHNSMWYTQIIPGVIQGLLLALLLATSITLLTSWGVVTFKQ